MSSGGPSSAIFFLCKASSVSSSAAIGDVNVDVDEEGLSLVLASSSDTRICCCEKVSLTSLDTSTRNWASLHSWSFFAASSTLYLLHWTNPRTTVREEQMSFKMREGGKRERERERERPFCITITAWCTSSTSLFSWSMCQYFRNTLLFPI